jgi:hypothetical protein
VTRVAWTLLRAGGWPRALLIAACTAVSTGLLLVVVSLLRLPEHPEEYLFSLVADPGTRYGTAFGAALLVVPPLLLLHQAVRLGSAVRERRLAALRVAGATPAEVRRLGALEVGVPALGGSVAGVGVYLVLRVLLGGTPAVGGFEANAVRLVPLTVAPTWWQGATVVVAVAAAGVAVGLAGSRGVVVTPLGVTRRQPPSSPRPWGLLLLAALPIAGATSLVGGGGLDPQLLGSAVVAAAVLGMVALASWVAARTGRLLEPRARSAAALLAARRLAADPRPAGRAAAAVGGIALVAGGAAVLLGDVLGNDDPFYLRSLALVAGCLLIALAVAAASLAVHSVESLLDHKRSVASLAALGTGVDELGRAQRLEAVCAALPLAGLGVALGSAVLLPMTDGLSARGLAVVVANLLLTPALVWLALVAATRATAPLLRRAADPGHLRTE